MTGGDPGRRGLSAGVPAPNPDRPAAFVLDPAEERLSDDERREDLYLSSLGHYVSELGGRLEVRAVFDDGEVLVRGAR